MYAPVKTATLVCTALLCLAPRTASSQAGFDLLTLQGSGSTIGVEVRELETADGKDRASESGALITDVRQGSPAAKAGFQAGDIVLEFDGEKVRSARSLRRVVQETRPGHEVKALVARGGSRQTLSVTPQLPAESTRKASTFDAAPFLRSTPQNGVLPQLLFPPGNRLGASVTELTAQLAQYFGVKHGVLVVSVSADSAAEQAGLKAGDVITDVNGQRISSTSDVTAAVARGAGGQPIELHVIRDKKDVRLTVTMPSPAQISRPGKTQPL